MPRDRAQFRSVSQSAEIQRTSVIWVLDLIKEVAVSGSRISNSIWFAIARVRLSINDWLVVVSIHFSGRHQA